MGDEQGIHPNESERALPRRGMIAGALAVAVGAIALERPDTASAHDPDDVRLGGANSSAKETVITSTDNTSATALVVHADNGVTGTGLEATARTYGVQATGGAAGVFGDTSGTQSAGVTGLARSTDGGFGMTASNACATQHAGFQAVSPGVAIIGGAGATYFVDDFDPPSRPVGIFAKSRDATGIGAIVTGGRAPLQLLPSETEGPPAEGEHTVGELVVSSDGRLFFCSEDGEPGTWVELGVQPIAPPKRSTLVLLPTPERFVDTRSGLGGVKGPIAARNTLSFVMSGRDGQASNSALRIPDAATAVIGNLTAVGGASAVPGAFLTLWPGGDQPTVSNLNYGPGLTIANSFVVGLAPVAGHGTVKVFNHSDCDYILDVSGYYIDL